jgi:hypothetical protein
MIRVNPWLWRTAGLALCVAGLCQDPAANSRTPAAGANAKAVGDLTRFTLEAAEAEARVRLFITDPLVTRRVPDLAFESAIAPISAVYYAGTKPGESVTFTLRRGATVLVTENWRTYFRSPVSNLLFERAQVDIAGP